MDLKSSWKNIPGAVERTSISDIRTKKKVIGILRSQKSYLKSFSL